MALSFDRSLVALDEPSAAMDVPTRRSVWDRLRSGCEAGGAYVVSSHYLEESSGMVDAILAIKNGRIEMFEGVEHFCEAAPGKPSNVNDAFMLYYDCARPE